MGRVRIYGAPVYRIPFACSVMGERRNLEKRLGREGGVGEGEEGTDGPRAAVIAGGPEGAGCGVPGKASGSRAPRPRLNPTVRDLWPTQGHPLRLLVLSTVKSGLSPPSPPPAQTPAQRTPVTQGADRRGSAPRPGPCPLFQEHKSDRISFSSCPGAMPVHPFPGNPLPSPRKQGRLCQGAPSDCCSLDGSSASGMSSSGCLVIHDVGRKLSWSPQTSAFP